jgi:hypothetical protein
LCFVGDVIALNNEWPVEEGETTASVINLADAITCQFSHSLLYRIDMKGPLYWVLDKIIILTKTYDRNQLPKQF